MIRPEIRIEFIGGPFDGHEQTIFTPPKNRTSTLALPVNENVFLMLDGQKTGPARLTPNVALYELRGEEERQYHYVGTRPAAQFGLHEWKV